MFIRNCLTPKRDLEILKTGMTIGQALERMNRLNLYSLPVVDENETFVGILSKRSLFEYLEKEADALSFAEFRKLPIDPCVDKNAQMFVDIEKDHLEDCLPVIVRYPFVPVIDENKKFLGIVKRSAIERALESAFGVHVPGVRFMIAVDDMEGTLLEITKLIHKYEVNIIAIIAFEAGETFVRRILLKLEPNEFVEQIREDLEEHGYRVLEVNHL